MRPGFLLACLVAAVSLGASPPVPAPVRIALPWGYVELTTNEVSVVSTVDDPPAVRLVSVGRALGKVSFNRLRPDGRQEEVAILQGKIDERYPSRLAGEVTIHVRNLGTGDSAMVPVLLLRSDEAVFYVPVYQARR